MKLLIIRHAIAEDKEVWAQTGAIDDDRPLTTEGREKMARGAAGLHTIISDIKLLATSPLLRARQTGEIVATEYGLSIVSTTETLLPSEPFRSFADWLTSRANKGVIAVVGHEPHLSGLATWLLTGAEESRLELKKGAACLISFDETPGPGAGRLRWSLAPAQLRGLAS
ncbi:MAG: phosphohistidine phosphatase SixA [Gemmatimonadaceae bacterium]